ncbi:MAG: MarC family protein [Candidatus Woesearchaeota archaeon]
MSVGLVDFAYVWVAFIGLFAILNPFSTALVFLGLTSHTTHAYRVAMAKKSALIAATVLIVFMITGSMLFKTFSITIEAFKIAGGLLIAKVGFSMINPESRSLISESDKQDSQFMRDISIVPLAIPMMSGPGAITTSLVWISNAPTFATRMALWTLPIIISFITFFVLKHADDLKKLLRPTGIDVIERVMGLIVLVMGIQFILNALFVDLLPRLMG